MNDKNQFKAKAWRNDAYAKVTGRAKYTDDIKYHNMLHAVPVYTDHVHAKINNIDTTIAEKSPGVVKIITATDVPGKVVWGQLFKDHDLLASKKIRYHGDVVALVVATTRAAAISAAELVKVNVEPLPPILDLEKAFADKTNLVHEEKSDNIVNHHKVRRGDIAQGFADSEYIIEQKFTTQFIEHAYIEPESAVAVPNDNGVMQVYATVQHHFTARKFAAAILGVKLSEVEILGVPLGGGFGGKDDTGSIVCARTALAAKLTGRPVKMTYTREWSIRESYKRHPYIMEYKMGVTKQGKINAVQCKILADAGAYASMTPFVTWRSTVQCAGPYLVPNVCADVYGVYTNHVFTGAMRGFGSPQINFAIEQLIDMAAEKVGMSAIKFREQNLVTQDCVTITGQKLDNHTVSSHEVLEKVLTAIDYENKFKKCSFGKSSGSGDSDELYGIGIANSYRGMSLGAEGFDFCSAIINCQFDGSILLEVGYQENGQGLEAAMVLLLAAELGVPKERIRYLRSSTSVIPDGGPCVASRGVLMAGGALVNAAKDLKTLIATALALKLNCTASEVRFENDCVVGKANNKLTWDDAMQEMFRARTYPYAFGLFQPPSTHWDEEKGQGPAYFTWVYGCQAVELSVNSKTGKVKILNVVAAHDVGKALNPAMLLGQYYGGITQGIGYALSEEVTDQAGKITSLNFNTYKIPRASDLPDITGIIVENSDPTSPSKAKGIGEPALELMAPAIANAIYHATGKRYYNLPIKINK
ncbi:MAG: xanthine dehydrogenase family protein molybdopterin-binding subunit [Gammaproteobacteria bacterium]|nr:xanthine dehydrogenase family protein molybdopterin-binding subunit [Gammaproteobacteria bacterium]